MRSKPSNAQRDAPAADTGVQAPPGHEILLCEKTFAGFRKSLSGKDLDDAVQLCLVEGDIRLLRIAGARAQKDRATVAREADALGRMAASLGFLQAAGLAWQLEDACLSGTATLDLIGRLSEAFQISGAMLDALLRRDAIAGP